jgi:DNA-binding GntR family transcriptional regulator
VKLATAIVNRDAPAAEQLATEHISRLAKLRLQMLIDGY